MSPRYGREGGREGKSCIHFSRIFWVQHLSITLRLGTGLGEETASCNCCRKRFTPLTTSSLCLTDSESTKFHISQKQKRTYINNWKLRYVLYKLPCASIVLGHGVMFFGFFGDRHNHWGMVAQHHWRLLSKSKILPYSESGHRLCWNMGKSSNKIHGFNQPSQLVKSDLGHQLYHFFQICAAICKDFHCFDRVKFSHESATFEKTGLPFVSFAKNKIWLRGESTQHLTVESHRLADLSFACAVASIAPQLAERHLPPASSTV